MRQLTWGGLPLVVPQEVPWGAWREAALEVPQRQAGAAQEGAWRVLSLPEAAPLWSDLVSQSL